MLRPEQSKTIPGSVRVSFKWLFPFLVGAFLALSPTQAKADEITVAGSTTGSFTGSGDFSSSGLIFAGNPFSQTTSGGFASIVLGAVSLGATALSSYNGSFSLDVTFTQPSIITGGPTSSFAAILVGSVTSSSGAAVLLNFSPSSQFLSFTNAADTGSFTLLVPSSLSVSDGKTTFLTGTILNGQQTPNVPAPEPSTILLSGLGLGGVFLMWLVWGDARVRYPRHCSIA
jgi:hypothetical protein